MNQTLGQTASSGPDQGRERQATFTLIFESDRPLAGSLQIPLGDREELSIGRGIERVVSEGRLLLPDPWLSGQHARLQRSFDRWLLVDEDSKNGCRVGDLPVKRTELKDGDIVELGRSFFLFRSDGSPGTGVVDTSRAAPATLSPTLREELAKLAKLAPTPISILILGESGTGKEVLARRIHKDSGRAGEFVAVNCGALPQGLVESELFGHVKGSFSGAVSDRIGLVRQAHRGTLLLDEVADLPASAQTTLLRVLQEQKVRPVGGNEELEADVRTISATHLDIDARVQDGSFRQDLYARIASYRLRLPPLRDRIEDLGLLFPAILPEGTTFSVEASRALCHYQWPLNIRELKASLATATVLADGSRIEVSHLPKELLDAADDEETLIGGDDARRDLLERLLVEHGGNVSAVARAMDKDRKQIQRWVKRYELDLTRFRST